MLLLKKYVLNGCKRKFINIRAEMYGIISLVLGIIVVGGAEPESMTKFDLNNSPMINITPNSKDIVGILTTLIENKIYWDQLDGILDGS